MIQVFTIYKTHTYARRALSQRLSTLTLNKLNERTMPAHTYLPIMSASGSSNFTLTILHHRAHIIIQQLTKSIWSIKTCSICKYLNKIHQKSINRIHLSLNYKRNKNVILLFFGFCWAQPYGNICWVKLCIFRRTT